MTAVADVPREIRPRSGMVAAFGSLVLSQVIGTGLGFAFWITAARAALPAEVAAASAAIAAMALLGNLATMGCGTLLIGELPLLEPAAARSLLRNAILTVTVVSGLMAVVGGLVAGELSPTFRSALGDPLSVVVFVVGVIATAVGLVTDQAVLGLKRAGTQVVRNLIAASLKFPLVLILVFSGVHSSIGLLLAWVLPMPIAQAALWRLLRLPRVPAVAGSVLADARRHLLGALQNHALNLAMQAATLFIPIIAAILLTTDDYAAFTLSWLVATFVFIPPFMLATALFATSVGDVADFSVRMRKTLPAGLALSGVLLGGVLLVAHLVLTIFGGRYSDQGAGLLRLLAIGGLALVVKDHYFALYRVEKRMTAAARIALLTVGLELGGAAAGALLGGMTGLALGWLAALYLQALLMTPRLVRLTRRPVVVLAARHRRVGPDDRRAGPVDRRTDPTPRATAHRDRRISAPSGGDRRIGAPRSDRRTTPAPRVARHAAPAASTARHYARPS